MPKGGKKSSPCKRPAATGFTLDEGSTGEGSGWQKRRWIANEDDISENTPVPEPPKSTGGKLTPTKSTGGKLRAAQADPPKGGKLGAARSDPPKGGKPRTSKADPPKIIGASRADPPKHIGGKPVKEMLKKMPKTPSKPRHLMTMKEICADWNRTGRCGLPTETTQGWLKKTATKREGQQKKLKQAKPGARVLCEIRHYQRCQMFLIAVLPFQCLVQEVSNNSPYVVQQRNRLRLLDELPCRPREQME